MSIKSYRMQSLPHCCINHLVACINTMALSRVHMSAKAQLSPKFSQAWSNIKLSNFVSLSLNLKPPKTA